ncbi:MAG: C45 family peptidase [Fimbriimonadaceae bacterium]
MKISRREALIATGAIALGGTTAFALKPKPRTKVIAGSASDALIARHVVISGSQSEVGKQIAQLGASHRAKLGSLTNESAKARRAWYQTYWPELSARAKGTCTELKKDYLSSTVDVFSLSYNSDFAAGCSCSFYPPDRTESGHALLGRNYDFSTGTLADLVGQPERGKGQRGFTADPYLMEIHPNGGYATLMMVAYDLLSGCIDGMNEHGLGVALLADDQANDAPRSSGAAAGISEIEMPRFLLERCKTVEDAIVAVKDVPYYFTFIPCHYIVGDASGNSAVLEWGARDKKLRVVRGARKPQAVTNHLLSAFKEDQLPAGNSFDRYRTLKAGFAVPKLSEAQIIKTHQSVMPRGSGTPMEGPVGRTLWHSIYDLTARSMKISFYLGESTEGDLNQRRTRYQEFSLR